MDHVPVQVIRNGQMARGSGFAKNLHACNVVPFFQSEADFSNKWEL